MNVLRALVIEDDSTGDLKMKSIDEVRGVLMENPQLSIEMAAQKTVKKLRSWNRALFRTPWLYEFHFKGVGKEYAEASNMLLGNSEDLVEEAEASSDTATENSSPIYSRAPDKRAAARAPCRIPEGQEQWDFKSSSDVEPPGAKASPKVSRGKRKQPVSGLLNQSKSAIPIGLDDDDDHDDDDDDGIPAPGEEAIPIDLPERVASPASPMPCRKKIKKSQQKSYAGRRAWTRQEKEAVKQGIRVFGVSQWAQIKGMWSNVLKDRTSQQIKDCYRTMLEKGELAEASNTLQNPRARPLGNSEDLLEEAEASSDTATENSSPIYSRAPDKRAAARAPCRIPEGQEQWDFKSSSDVEPPGAKASPKVSRGKRKQPVSGLLNQSKSAIPIGLDDDDDHDDDDDDGIPAPGEEAIPIDLPERVASPASPMPCRKKIKKSQQKSYAGRRAWTRQEKEAVKQGIRVFGVSQWAQIKGMWSNVLKDRTSQQIKDCYRTMLEKGELADVPHAG